MPHRAVFVDRDNTLIEDPGYLDTPSAVRLLPGVDLALRSLIQSEYKIVVVTNQSGVARGYLTEERLGEIHEELRRQLALKKLRVDAIYHCPYHPEGTVEPFATESDLRKPQPGMLLKAAEEMDIDLSASWMVGDSARDVMAGRRAGCKTVRLLPRRPNPGAAAEERDDPEAQADYTVSNLVSAARVILRADAGVAVADDNLGTPPPVRAKGRVTGRDVGETPAARIAAPAVKPPAAPDATPRIITADGIDDDLPDEAHMSDSQVLYGILHETMQINRRMGESKFSWSKMLAGLAQMMAVTALVMVFLADWHDAAKVEAAKLWGLVAVTLQGMALTLYVMSRHK